tara:strand:- start:392 stop:514 length:123 start_codon:yes stop_codon:yes gene_type:complete
MKKVLFFALVLAGFGLASCKQIEECPAIGQVEPMEQSENC